MSCSVSYWRRDEVGRQMKRDIDCAVFLVDDDVEADRNLEPGGFEMLG